MIDELVSKIIAASKEYYGGTSKISDSEFDKLVLKLRGIAPEHPLLKTTGYGFIPVDGIKFKHPYHMGSLDKIKIDDLQPRFSRYQIATPKIDGASISVYYEDGWLQKIVSRGDGSIGIEVTPNLIHAVPKHIPGFQGKMCIRGEASLSIEDWKIVGGKSPRNSANGLVQTKFSNQNTKFLILITYSIPWRDRPTYLTKKQQLDVLKSWGFTVVPYVLTSSKSDLKYENITINSKTYQTDGIVLSSDISTTIELENGYELNNDSIAIKFHEDVGESIIRNIEWNVTRTGRIVPVAIIEPINLSGATIKRVTCYNAKFIESSKLGNGSTIRLVRSNEIIPMITEVLKEMPASIPTECSLCGTKLTRTKTGIDLICENHECPSKLDAILVKILALTQPDGVGTINIDSLIDNIVSSSSRRDLSGKLNSLKKDIDASGTVSFINAFQHAYGNHVGILLNKMLVDLKTFTPTISQLVKCANIPAVGDTASEALNVLNPSRFNDPMVGVWCFDDILPLLPTEPSRKNFVKYFDRIKLIIKFFNRRIKDTSKVETISKIKVAVTGKMSVSRDEWYKLHKKCEESGVSRETKYLVTNEVSNSSKYLTAQKLGISIISESEFDKIYSSL
jgi:DNA ligase (NAD+)